MKLLLVTDAWMPQVNGVVTTLVELVRELSKLGHQVTVIHPGLFKTRPCPGYAGIDLAVRPRNQLAAMMNEAHFDAVHIATEGPLGWAARGLCKQRGWPFTTAFHTRFPEVLKAAVGIP
ncbi:MAG: GDP-mannose-dependent alpha-mannosyltransferase, partial [Pseudomonadota bacterium]